MAAIVVGKPNPAALSEIDLKGIAEKFKIQTIVSAGVDKGGK